MLKGTVGEDFGFLVEFHRQYLFLRFDSIMTYIFLSRFAPND